MDQVDAPDLTIAIEDVVVVGLQLAAFAGHLGAPKDQGGIGHYRRNSGLRILLQVAHPEPLTAAVPALSLNRRVTICVALSLWYPLRLCAHHGFVAFMATSQRRFGGRAGS
jgi:hypothetical protein